MSTANVNVSDIPLRDSPIMEGRKSSRPIGVKVSEYSRNHINPSPIKIPRDSDLLEEFLSPRKLQALTGVDDLDTVEYLEMRVNTEQMSLGNFGTHLPNLSQIKLSGSCIPSVRDLGTSLWALRVLWMPQCSLQCLDGLVTMSSLRELYLAYNEVRDISPCGMLEHLEILDLEGNLLADVACVHYLSMCQALLRLTLEGNPLCAPEAYAAPHTYRGTVCAMLPQLRFLDDLPPDYGAALLAAGDSGAAAAASVAMGLRDTANATLEFEDHWNFINAVLVEAGLLAGPARSPEDSGRPGTSSTCRPPSSAAGRARLSPGTAQRPLSARKRPDSTETVDSGQGSDERYEDSALTAGVVVCGSVTRSLRRRMAEEAGEASPLSSARSPRKPEDSLEESCDLVLRELDQWRRDYQRSKTRIEKQRAPQVLTIDYSEEEIEAVELPRLVKAPPVATKPKAKERAAEVKLKPVRVNGKLPVVEAPMSRVSSGPQTPPSLEAAPAAPQVSRMRRQLLQAGVSAVMPSRPRLSLQK